MRAILNVALPIFGVILAGYLAGRFRVLGVGATAALTAFVSTFALPVLFFGTLAGDGQSAFFNLLYVLLLGLVLCLSMAWSFIPSLESASARSCFARRRKPLGGLSRMLNARSGHPMPIRTSAVQTARGPTG